MDYKFNIENKSVEGYQDGKMILRRIYGAETYIFDENGNILDTLVYDEEEKIREGIRRTDAFFNKHNIDQEAVVNLFRENKKYIDKKEDISEHKVLKIMRLKRKEA